MAATIVEINTDAYASGTDMKNLNGFRHIDQGGSMTSKSDIYPVGYSVGTSCISTVGTAGLWCSTSTSGVNGTFSGVDFRGNFKTAQTDVYLGVRGQNDTHFNSGYGIRLNGGANAYIYKMCGGTPFIQVSKALTHSLSIGVNFRIVMEGLVLRAWVNGEFIGEYDFTGNALCSSATYNTGSVGFVYNSNVVAYLGRTKSPDTIGSFI